jgi:hypothetical protein
MNDPAGSSGSAQPYVSQRVNELLSQSPAYAKLPPARQAEIARDTEKIAQYIVGGATGANVPGGATLVGAPDAARALAGFPQLIRQPQTAGGRMAAAGGAVAAQQGSAAFTGMIREVNFPSFVAGLIDGVFNAIVTASIKQMEAYGELVKNVAKSVDEFMKDNISENSARDYLADRYPDHLEVDMAGESPTLRPKEGSEDSELPDFFKELGLSSPVDSLDEDTTEQVLVPAARRRMAMDRQQLLATMVLMGINRLVVTDGSITASCTFTLDTKDLVTQHRDRASEYDRTSDWSSEAKVKQDWYDGSWKSSGNAHFNVTTHQSEDSTAAVDMHAKLGGNVKVNFKSDYFPLEKIADVLQINEIQQKAPAGMQPGAAPLQPGAVPGTPGTVAPPVAPLAPGQPAPAR